MTPLDQIILYGGLAAFVVTALNFLAWILWPRRSPGPVRVEEEIVGDASLLGRDVL